MTATMFRRPALTCITAAVIAGLLLVPHRPGAQEQAYPGAVWQHVPDIAGAGWSAAGLKAARDFSQTIPTAAVVIVSGGLVVDEWGDTATRYNVHSIRKS